VRHSGVPEFIRTASFDERPLFFGPSEGLAGILCCPRTASFEAAPTVIMVNTGFGRRIGDGRVYVTLARRLAAIGVPSLRMDLSGFGDSREEPGIDADPYSIRHVEDVVAAINALEQTGLRHPLLIGICSGAHTVFHSALADRRVHGIVAVNLQKFIWKAGASLKVENRRQRRPISFYLRAAGAFTAWRRVVSGDVAILPILAVLVTRPFSSAFRRACLRLETVTGIGSRAGATARDVAQLSARGTRLDLIYSEDDPGLAELSQHFGTRLRGLNGMPGVHVHVIGAADHALLDHTARLQFVEMMVDELRGAVEPGLEAMPVTAAPVRLAPVPAA
jgi:pimeloyl-ACP methyl ester carboxylesterase